jgi:hypothetical protein
MKIVQVIRYLPPYAHGIGDYAISLGEKLWSDYGILSYFISSPEDIRRSEPIFIQNRFIGMSLPDYRPDSLLSQFPQDATAVVVHFDFYLCPWLKAFRALKRSKPIKIIVIFHEVIPRLSWYEYIRSTVKQVLPAKDPGRYRGRMGFVKLADVILTNTDRFQKLVSQWVDTPVIKVLNFSTVGELEPAQLLRQRSHRLVVFGTEGTRHRAYYCHRGAILSCCQQLGITEIYDIGPWTRLQFPKLPGISIVKLGDLPSQEVSQILADSFAGFLDYSHQPGTLGKSSIFAAYCAHGLVPVSATYDPSEADGVELNQHYISAKDIITKDTLAKDIIAKDMLAKDTFATRKYQDLSSEKSLKTFEKVAKNAHTWYQTHTLKKGTKVFVSCLFSVNR